MLISPEQDPIEAIHYLYETPAVVSDQSVGVTHLTCDEIGRLFSNTLGDIPWAAVSAASINVRGKQTAEFWSTTAAQITYSVPLPFLTYAVLIALNNEISRKKALASFISMATAMITWNLGQYYGEQLFNKQGMSDKNAGYAASPCTGLAEGVAQVFVYDLILAMLGDEVTKASYRQFSTNPLRASLFFASYLLTSSVGGVVWQLIYNAIFPNCTNTPTDCTNATAKNIALVAFTVGLGVAATNYAASVAFKASVQGLNKFLPSVKETPAVRPDDLAEPFLDIADSTASEHSLRTV